MLESLVIDRIIFIFDNNIPIENIPSMEIIDNSKMKQKETIFVIERRLKQQINTVVLKYGIAKSLEKLILFIQDLKKIEYDKNAVLLSIGAKTLYDRIQGFYIPIVYARLVKWFPKLSQGTITSEEILTDIKNIPFSEEFLLGIVEPEVEQFSLFGDVADATSNDLAIALDNKNKVKNAAIKAIKKAYSPNELNDLCFRLSDILNADNDIRTTIFLRCFLNEMTKVIKKNSKIDKVDTRQLKIGQF